MSVTLQGFRRTAQRPDSSKRTAIEETRRRHGDLPYSFAALNFEVARTWLTRVREGFDRSAAVTVPAGGAAPAQLYDHARASLDQWMKQWSAMWSPRSLQMA